MVPTLEYIKQKFAHFNQLIFQDRVPQVPISMGHSKTQLGCVRYKVKRKPDGTKEVYNLRLTISAHYDLPEAEVEDTLIHEMMHLYIHSRQLQDSSPHGRLFRQLMDHINQHFGRHITISYKGNGSQGQPGTSAGAAASPARKKRLVCVCQLPGGRTGVTVAPKTRIFEFWRALPQIAGVTGCRWFVSTAPLFGRLPKSLKPTVYCATRPEELEAALRDPSTCELEKVGNTIKTVKRG